MFSKIRKLITKHNLINQNDTIIIGLSGGPDSVFLLHMLMQIQQEYNLTLIAAHLNHEWRAQADAEEELCRTMACHYNIPFFSEKLSRLSHSIKLNGSKEEYARKIRRHFLEKLLHENNASSIALGHHAQDQQETFFIRLIRGTSLTGLAAIKPKHGMYIRPLLETNKPDIIAWLKQNNITYATDISNESSDFLRNRIRKNILPALHECDERFDTNFLITLQRLKQDEAYFAHTTHQLFDSITTKEKNRYSLNIAAFFDTDQVFHHRLVIHWLITENVPFHPSQAFFDEIIRFLQSPRGGTHSMHPQWSIIKKQNCAHIIKT